MLDTESKEERRRREPEWIFSPTQEEKKTQQEIQMS